MIERIPTPDGGLFVMEFDLWTDDAERPMGYRINKIGGKPSTSGIVGFRKGYEDVRSSPGHGSPSRIATGWRQYTAPGGAGPSLSS